MKQKHARALFIVVMSTSLIFFILYFPFQRSVVFYYENTDELIAYLPISKEETFQIIFTHSIHLTDVIEKYRITDDHQIEQYEIVFEEFGIGMPSGAEEGEEFVYEDGKYHIRNLSNRFSSINIRNGKTVSQHRLVWGKNEEHKIWFNDYFIPGAWYSVKVEHLSLWQFMKGVKIHD